MKHLYQPQLARSIMKYSKKYQFSRSCFIALLRPRKRIWAYLFILASIISFLVFHRLSERIFGAGSKPMMKFDLTSVPSSMNISGDDFDPGIHISDGVTYDAISHSTKQPMVIIKQQPRFMLRSQLATKREMRSRPLIILWGRKYKNMPEYWRAYPRMQKIIRGDNLTNYILNGKLQKRQCCEGVDMTGDRSLANEATAIVIYHQFINKRNLPKTRREDQLWVLFGQECPQNSADLTPYNGLFNWTMTYRMDSDIPIPHGDFALKNPQDGDIKINGLELDDFVSKKRSLMTSVVSHCKTNSKREVITEQIRNEGNITLDVYGGCGAPGFFGYSYKCRFWADLAQEYKFYFAGENSLCSDYVTEKFYRAMELGMVPVAYGGADYKSFAPKGSFIYYKDFHGPKELANYLQRLDKDDNEYKKYFEWRRKYQIQVLEWEFWCGLCDKVKEYFRNEKQTPGVHRKVYKDLGRWWKTENGRRGNACKKPKLN